MRTELVIAFLTTLSTAASAELVTYYSFSGNANDSSGHGNNATVHEATLTTDRFGNQNSAYHFDGINDYLSASASGLPTGERTVAFWFLAETVSNHPAMLGYGGGVCGSSFFVGANASKAIYVNSIYVTGHCDQNSLIHPYSSAPIGSWEHFAATTSATGTRIYLNGTLAASNSTYIQNTVVSGKALEIGVDVSPAGTAPYTDINVNYFKGSLDEIRIYNTALSAQQISQLATVPEPFALQLWAIGLGFLPLMAKWMPRPSPFKDKKSCLARRVRVLRLSVE